jgi:hypothetical protein
VLTRMCVLTQICRLRYGARQVSRHYPTDCPSCPVVVIGARGRCRPPRACTLYFDRLRGSYFASLGLCSTPGAVMRGGACLHACAHQHVTTCRVSRVFTCVAWPDDGFRVRRLGHHAYSVTGVPCLTMHFTPRIIHHA